MAVWPAHERRTIASLIRHQTFWNGSITLIERNRHTGLRNKFKHMSNPFVTLTYRPFEPQISILIDNVRYVNIISLDHRLAYTSWSLMGLELVRLMGCT